MSDTREEVISTRRTRRSALRSEESSHCNDGSGDEIDDSLSTVTTGSIADDSSRCDTPPHSGRRRKSVRLRQNSSAGRCRLQFKCTYNIKEDHGQPIFGAQFNYFSGVGEELLLATVGGNRVTIYECSVKESKDGDEPPCPLKLLQAYADVDSDENFYTCAWTSDDVTGLPLLAAAGSRGLIRIINPLTATCTKHYTGHGQSINELKFHPRNCCLLLSVSKDHSLRLWNIKTDVCVAIFGGVDGHRDEVLSGDIDITGTYIVSCGMDHSVKIWSLQKPCIANAIEQSFQYTPTSHTDRSFATVAQHYPDFSTRDIHSNYVDCARWFGRFVLSKSCENRIVLWKPGSHTSELHSLGSKPSPADGTSVSHLHQFDFAHCNIWFMRFAMDHRQKMLAVGNQNGKVYLWDIDVDDPSQTRYTVLSHAKCTTPVRQTAFSKDGSILVCVCDDATVWRWDRVAP